MTAKQIPHSGTCADIEAVLLETAKRLRQLETESIRKDESINQARVDANVAQARAEKERRESEGWYNHFAYSNIRVNELEGTIRYAASLLEEWNVSHPPKIGAVVEAMHLLQDAPAAKPLRGGQGAGVAQPLNPGETARVPRTRPSEDGGRESGGKEQQSSKSAGPGLDSADETGVRRTEPPRAGRHLAPVTAAAYPAACPPHEWDLYMCKRCSITPYNYILQLEARAVRVSSAWIEVNGRLGAAETELDGLKTFLRAQGYKFCQTDGWTKSRCSCADPE